MNIDDFKKELIRDFQDLGEVYWAYRLLLDELRWKEQDPKQPFVPPPEEYRNVKQLELALKIELDHLNNKKGFAMRYAEIALDYTIHRYGKLWEKEEEEQ